MINTVRRELYEAKGTDWKFLLSALGMEDSYYDDTRYASSVDMGNHMYAYQIYQI